MGPEDPAAVRVVLHVDMDAFYAAVEVLDDPSLAGRPLIVGGDGPRGVVASCSYEARRFGVRSAMPSTQARRLCPHALFRPGRFDRYHEVSERIHEVFHRYTPLVEGIALDEAFLDLTGAQRLLGPGVAVAERLRADVQAATGLACSVGVAPSKFLAKLASEAAKPRADRDGIRPGLGVVVIAPGEELEFLRPLAVEALWGVGPATAARLRGIGIATIAQLGETPLPVLESVVGRAHGRHLHQLAHAIDPRPVEPDRATKSIGHEETYAVDRYDRDGLRLEVVRMADSVATRLRRAGLAARTVQVKVRGGDFRTLTRARTVGRALRDGPSIARLATALLDAVEMEVGVRLLGVSVSSLEPGGVEAEQLALGLVEVAADQRPAAPRREAAAGAVDAVRARFGERAVGPGSLVGPGGLRVGRPGDNRWAPVDPAETALPSP
ncbi:MAG: DNA polymerase IV [Acidimicrobiales bacterium]